MDLQLTDLFKMAVVAFEAAAVLLLVFGVAWAAVRAAGQLMQGDERLQVYRTFRQGFGRTLLLAMDLLVAADIILTVTLELSFKSLGMLGLLIVIRGILHLAVEAEVGNVVPRLKPAEKAE